MNRTGRAMSQRDIYQGELGQSAPGTPQKVLQGWSAQGILLTPAIAFDGLTSTLITQPNEVGLQAEFPESGPYTISFNLRIPPGTSNLAPFRAEALVTWSVAGNSVSRRVSVGNGISISCVAEAVSVVVKDTTDPLFASRPFLVVDSIPYTVVINVARGTRPAYNQPPTLNPFPSVDGMSAMQLLAAGATLNVPVPQDAGIISVHVAVCKTTVFTPIQDQQVLVTQTGNQVEKRYDPRATDWEPVNPDITVIGITNHSANEIGVSAVFGIDG